MLRSRTTNISLCSALLVSSGIFYLFSYNSGYGYDALEYLVLGRSLAEGTPFYTYLPSKSPVIYYLIAGLYKLGVDFEHVSLAAVITVIYVFTCLTTYFVTRRWFPATQAIIVTCLTGAAAFFMELNFLQPTALFYICGLVAFDRMLRFDRARNDWALFAAGVALGVGMAIKSSTAFYGLAAGHYLILLSLREHRSWYWLFQSAFVLGAGVLIVLSGLLAYYWTQGSAHAFIDWTFVFPFAHYPSHTTYIAKAYTKLLWVNGFIVCCFPLLMNAKLRAISMNNRPAILALLFGGCSYLALLKTQSSHYFFPGAPFLFMFAVAVYAIKLRGVELSRQVLLKAGAVAATLAIVVGASIILYRPDAVRRLASIKEFSADENAMRTFVQTRVPQDRYLLITGGPCMCSTWSYWISHRYPPPPFINADVKTIWMLRNQPQEVFRVLEHPLLTMVQFDPSQIVSPVLEDVFGNEPHDAEIMRDYLTHVRRRFEPIDERVAQVTFWRRADPKLAALDGR